MAEGEIDNLTMEIYLALTRGNHAPGVVKLEIRGNVNLKKSQFIRELREDTFSENKNGDAHEQVEGFLDIVSLFNILGVLHDVVMLCFFPMKLTGAAKRWVDRISPWTVDSCDLLQKSLSKGAARHQKPLSSLKKSATSSKKPSEGAHLDKECPLNEEVKSVDEVKYGDFRCSSSFSNGDKYHVGPPGYYTRIDNRLLFGEKWPSLEELMNKHLEESTGRRDEMEEWMKKL
nr:DNA-binding pseudobarrel domain-containing protein [Tanacetum cinerariifolium]